MPTPAPLYPPITPARTGMLPVDERHTLYWEESGRSDGVPVVLLHGGPGSGTSPEHRRFFDPAHYRIILFDQRGAGHSTPCAEVRDNTTALLVADMERLRRFLGIERWVVFGGSWGSTLALAYAQQHRQRCLGLLLRGIFLCTAAEIDWFLHGMGQFFPQAEADFRALLAAGEDAQRLAAYARRLFGDDAAQRLQAARAWNQYESRCLHLLAQPDESWDAQTDSRALAVARLEAHYFVHEGFLAPQQLLRGAASLQGIPALIVQGRYDVVCPPRTAWQLHRAWPGSQLQIIDAAGHSAFEPPIAAALVAAMDRFRDQGAFAAPGTA